MNTVNELLSDCSKTIVPEVGMGCTRLQFSDRRAATIVEVSKSGKQILVQDDTATRVDKNGFSDCQKYEYERNTEAYKRKFTLRKNGKWIEVGASLDSCGYSLLLNVRREYYDFSY